MFGLSGSHLLILAIIILLFGSRRLPELGSALGQSMKAFKDALDGRNAITHDQKPEAERVASSGGKETGSA